MTALFRDPGQFWPLKKPLVADLSALTAELHALEVTVADLGSGTGVDWSLAAPPSPSAYDDEFTASSLDGKWTPTTTFNDGAAVTYGEHGTWARLVHPSIFSGSTYAHSTGNSAVVLQQALGADGTSGVALSVTARFSITIPNGAYADAYIRIGVNPTDTGSYLYWGVTANGKKIQTIKYDGSGITNDVGLGTQTLWVHLQRDTNNRVGLFWSADGIGWNGEDFNGRAWDAAYLQVLLRVSPGSGNPGGSVACDFVRVNDARFFQPMA